MHLSIYSTRSEGLLGGVNMMTYWLSKWGIGLVKTVIKDNIFLLNTIIKDMVVIQISYFLADYSTLSDTRKGRKKTT